MISRRTAANIVVALEKYWRVRALQSPFAELIAAPGEYSSRLHELAEQETVQLLVDNFGASRMLDKKGDTVARSRGDAWLEGMPINIKFGDIDGKKSDPNMVSMSRLFNALTDPVAPVENYYVLGIKVGKRSGECRVYMFDLLDHLDYANFYSGPGQITLNERKFFNQSHDTACCGGLTRAQKVQKLMAMAEHAHVALLATRVSTIEDMRIRAKLFQSDK